MFISGFMKFQNRDDMLIFLFGKKVFTRDDREQIWLNLEIP